MAQKNENAAAYKKGERITLLCLVGNIALTLFKFLAGFLGNSHAMVADALHSASDVLATIAVYFGIIIAKKPSDKDHPYGHGKIEPIVSAFVGLTLIFATYSIVRSTVNAIMEGNFAPPSALALVAAMFSIVIKEIMFRTTMKVGKEINSQSIIANAWDHRSDAYSSIGTLIGIGGSMFGSWSGLGFLRFLDPVAAFVVAILIFKVSLEILIHAFHSLMDGSPKDDTLADILNTAAILYAEDKILLFKGRYSGRDLYVDMTIEVDSALSVVEAHDIAEKIRSTIKHDYPQVSEIMIHVDPAEDGVAKEPLSADEALPLDVQES